MLEEEEGIPGDITTLTMKTKTRIQKLIQKNKKQEEMNQITK
jgi:hypothetical protein